MQVRVQDAAALGSVEYGGRWPNSSTTNPLPASLPPRPHPTLVLELETISLTVTNKLTTLLLVHLFGAVQLQLLCNSVVSLLSHIEI